jgi:hypothetical protein
MHQDCFETYLISQIRKATEQDNMVTDSTKYQYLCPLCKKLGNLFVPYVETDSAKIDHRESVRAKAAVNMRKKLSSEGTAGADAGAGEVGVPGRGVVGSSAHLMMTLIAEDDASPSQFLMDSIAQAATEVKLPVAFRLDMSALHKSSIPLYPAPSTIIASLISASPTSFNATKISTSPKLSPLPVWSWLTWIRHPSLLNHDLGAYSRYGSSMLNTVTFAASAGDTSDHSNALKRARSQTNDSTEIGPAHSKVNANFSPPHSSMEGASEMRMSIDEADDNHYSLNDIDLNSTSTDRNYHNALHLENTLRGITLSRRGSLDEPDFDFETVLDFPGIEEEEGKAVEAGERNIALIERTKRLNQRIVEALVQHSSDDMLIGLLKKKAWSK